MSGSAFDEYRAGTLRRLEEKHREFKEFLQRLRQAKDKASDRANIGQLQG